METERPKSWPASGCHLSVTSLRCLFSCSTGGRLAVPADAARQHPAWLASTADPRSATDSVCCVNETLYKKNFPRCFSAFHHHLTPGEQVPLRQVLLFKGTHTVQTGVNSQIHHFPFCRSKVGEGIFCCAGIMRHISVSVLLWLFSDADLATVALQFPYFLTGQSGY